MIDIFYNLLYTFILFQVLIHLMSKDIKREIPLRLSGRVDSLRPSELPKLFSNQLPMVTLGFSTLMDLANTTTLAHDFF